MLNKEHENELSEPFVDALIRASGNDPDTMTEFKKGDFTLRNLLASEWQSRDSAQQALNYLHSKYKSDYYQLSPLRSKDWMDIKESKVNGIEVTQEFVKAWSPEVITTTELHEIYTVIMSDTNRIKNKQNFTADIKDNMHDLGYDFKRVATLKNNIREDIFIKVNAIRGAAHQYVAQYDRYIKTEIVNNRQIKHLIWPDVVEETVNEELFDRAHFNNILKAAKKQ
jgi:hypothetical protein